MAIGLASILVASPGAAPADETTPVVVTAYGEGPPVRVQAYASPLPNRRRGCNSGPENDQRILDARVAPGQTVLTQTSAPCVCFRHTHGAFREIEFTPFRGVCKREARPARDAYFDGAAFRIWVEADRVP